SQQLTTLAKYPVAETLLSLAGLMVVLIISHYIVKRILYRIVAAFSPRFPDFVRQLVHSEALFRRLANFVPILIFHQAIGLIPHLSPGGVAVSRRLAVVAAVILGIGVLTLLLSKPNE